MGLVALAGYLALLGGLPLAATAGPRPLAQFDRVYRAGALVYGGGHVVPPLLKAGVVDPRWISPYTFLAGHGAAQAMPGPLFAFGAYLGAVMGGPLGALLGLLAIFLPGFLALVGVLPFWAELRASPAAQAALRGANAAIVGLLAAALYGALWTTTIRDPSDVLIAASGFVALVTFRWPPIFLLALGIGAGIAEVLWRPWRSPLRASSRQQQTPARLQKHDVQRNRRTSTVRPRAGDRYQPVPDPLNPKRAAVSRREHGESAEPQARSPPSRGGDPPTPT